MMRLMVLGVAAAGLLAGAARASTYAEVGDAGQTLATAATISGAGAVTDITGGLATAGDADLYKIYIATLGAFSATTNVGGTSFDLDTELFLLSATGTAIAVNDDDASGITLNSTLPAGNGLYASLAAGWYYLGISNSGNEPVNLNNQLLFAGNSDTTQVRGAAGGLNPTTLSDFDGEQYDGNLPGAYQIHLSGVTSGPSTGGVPEPKSWALMLAGFGLAGAALRRRRDAVAGGL